MRTACYRTATRKTRSVPQAWPRPTLSVLHGRLPHHPVALSERLTPTPHVMQCLIRILNHTSSTHADALRKRTKPGKHITRIVNCKVRLSRKTLWIHSTHRALHRRLSRKSTKAALLSAKRKAKRCGLILHTEQWGFILSVCLSVLHRAPRAHRRRPRVHRAAPTGTDRRARS